jgi:hypothetical protein
VPTTAAKLGPFRAFVQAMSMKRLLVLTIATREYNEVEGQG